MADRTPTDETVGGAIIDGEHRYHLWRAWEPSPARSVCFVMLNPSTADAMQDDPTIRKCIGFAKRWGFPRVDVVNLYSLRSPSPKVLKAAGYPNGPEADRWIELAARHSAEVVYAWGSHAKPDRARQVDAIVCSAGRTPTALRTIKSGAPEHPLYIPYATERRPYVL